MNYKCKGCRRYCFGEVDQSPGLEPAVVCEYCGSEIKVLTEEEDSDEINVYGS